MIKGMVNAFCPKLSNPPPITQDEIVHIIESKKELATALRRLLQLSAPAEKVPMNEWRAAINAAVTALVRAEM